MAPAVLALDAGTTNVKALLIDAHDLSVRASSARPVGIAYPGPGEVEQDAQEIAEASLAVLADCLSATEDVIGIAITNQREAVVAWRRSTGEPLGPLLGWQDVRTAAACREWRSWAGDLVRERSGLTLDAMYSAPKMRWLLDQAVAAGTDIDDLCLGTVDAWLLWQLTGDFCTEAGNASRTLLLDLRTCAWDDELLRIFGIPRACLPDVRASVGPYGVTRELPGIPAGLPVLAVLADSHAALYGHGCHEPGSGKATFGTGTSVMTPVIDATTRANGVDTTLAWQVDEPTYALEGNILATGAAIDWMARVLMAEADVTTSSGEALSRLAECAEGDSDVCVVPAFTGLGAPHWDREATAIVSGVTAATTREQLAAATFEGVAHCVADVVDAMAATEGFEVRAWHVDGGASASTFLLQAQADLLGAPILVGDVPEGSARGVALLAARAAGHDPVLSQPSRRVDPRLDAGELHARRARWRDAVRRSRMPKHDPIEEDS